MTPILGYWYHVSPPDAVGGGACSAAVCIAVGPRLSRFRVFVPSIRYPGVDDTEGDYAHVSSPVSVPNPDGETHRMLATWHHAWDCRVPAPAIRDMTPRTQEGAAHI